MDQKLDHFRAQIDAIDTRIIALIKERVQVVAQVAALKHAHAPHVFPIRPAREAQMVRRIVNAFAGSGFSPAAAAQIWRILIGASTATEAPLTIVAHPDFASLAREYFSAAGKISVEPDIQHIIADVTSGTTAIGIVPTASDWWKYLPTGADSPKIFAKLPFVIHDKNASSAFVLARLAPENSGDDHSLFISDTGALIEHQGFADTHANARFLGAYATPFTIED